MSKFLEKESSDTLYRAIVSLQDVDECRRFFQDLCTVSELKAMEQRMEVAMLLDQGLIYSDILERTGASSATLNGRTCPAPLCWIWPAAPAPSPASCPCGDMR